VRSPTGGEKLLCRPAPGVESRARARQFPRVRRRDRRRPLVRGVAARGGI